MRTRGIFWNGNDENGNKIFHTFATSTASEKGRLVSKHLSVFPVHQVFAQLVLRVGIFNTEELRFWSRRWWHNQFPVDELSRRVFTIKERVKKAGETLSFKEAYALIF